MTFSISDGAELSVELPATITMASPGLIIFVCLATSSAYSNKMSEEVCSGIFTALTALDKLRCLILFESTTAAIISQAGL